MTELMRKPASSTASGELTNDTQVIYGNKEFAGTTTFSGPTSMDSDLYFLNSFMNLAINGNMDFFQRGTSVTNRAAGDTNFLADRFKLTLVGTSAIYRMDRSTDIPSYAQSGFQGRYSLAIQVTTADASVAAGDLVVLRHPLEGNDYAAIASGAPFRVQFWAKSVKAGTYCLELRNDANDRYFVKEYTLAANTWTKVVFDFTSDTVGTWRVDEGMGLSVCWTLMAGSTFQGVADAWTAGNIRATANQVNFSDSTSNIFYLTQVMIVPGSFPSTANLIFKRAGRTIGDELRMCMRYYQQPRDLSDRPLVRMHWYDASALYFTYTLPTPMRAHPSIVNPTSYAIYTTSIVLQTGFSVAVVAGPMLNAIYFAASKGAHGLTEGVLHVANANAGLDAEI